MKTEMTVSYTHLLVPMDQYYEIIQNFGEDRAVYNYRTYMNLLVEDGLDAEVQAQAEHICGTCLLYTSEKLWRGLCSLPLCCC